MQQYITGNRSQVYFLLLAQNNVESCESFTLFALYPRYLGFQWTKVQIRNKASFFAHWLVNWRIPLFFSLSLLGLYNFSKTLLDDRRTFAQGNLLFMALLITLCLHPIEIA